ncbi:hypothetical protein HYALB_00002741 [Hymenoscyphus albidus]|uniref:SMODS and SLOG-associating 2TM effector domain-containing protein n=1 Tax=Hymenoscyphus albidus TaxID=595503 RepID=A0A9N9LMA8_9HELO|nr:hypothetical protein HYALB_00002741 [Hymenoscyphus albidus]
MVMVTECEQTPLLGSNAGSTGIASNLERFREAIGIESTSFGINHDLESARRDAKGLYKQILLLQRWRARQYHIVNTIYYFALGLQVLIGAVLASLGPLSKLHPTAITILGVLNASLAGILALLKGQGLPDRLRKDEYQMRKVQDFIEETDIRLAISGEDISRKELSDLVERVFAKYHTARDTAQMNKRMSYAHQSEVPQVDGSGVSGDVQPGKGFMKRNFGTDDEDQKGKGKFLID